MHDITHYSRAKIFSEIDKKLNYFLVSQRSQYHQLAPMHFFHHDDSSRKKEEEQEPLLINAIIDITMVSMLASQT